MSKRRTATWLIVDSVMLILCLALLAVDMLLIQDLIWALAALAGVFIFSMRVGRDIRTRRGI